jgi:hypothetical protein
MSVRNHLLNGHSTTSREKASSFLHVLSGRLHGHLVAIQIGRLSGSLSTLVAIAVVVVAVVVETTLKVAESRFERVVGSSLQE